MRISANPDLRSSLTDSYSDTFNEEPLDDEDPQDIVELGLAGADDAQERSATVAELAKAERLWQFGHVIVDEAQDLTPMQWRMIERRSLDGSMTIVGDLAQRSIGAPGTWDDHLPDSLQDHAYRELTINYRSPTELNELASEVLGELAPHLKAPKGIRQSGQPPIDVETDDIPAAIGQALLAARNHSSDSRIAIIASNFETTYSDDPRVQHLTPWQAKGLEFDEVIVVEPDKIRAEPNGLSLLYVAITRSTNRLTVIRS
jgi:DNA helicase IV